jgi:RNA polymerase sigma factor (sigma-70 family)
MPKRDNGGTGRAPEIDKDQIAGELLEAYGLSRCEETFEQLHRLIYPGLICLARFFVGKGRIDPDEVAHNVMTSLFLSCGRFQFRGAKAFRGWVCVIAHNTVRKAFRFEKSLHSALRRCSEPQDRGCNDPARLIVLQEEVETAARAWLLLVALCSQEFQRLPQEQQRVLKLRYGLGMTYQEIAIYSGKSASQVLGMVRRTRQQIYQHLLVVLGRWH